MIRPFFILIALFSLACKSQDSPLEMALSKGSPDFKKILRSPVHEVKIIYGEIQDDTIIHHQYGDFESYFYPASSIKMLNGFAILQWLNENQLEISSKLILDSSIHHPRRLSYDSLFADSIRVDNLLRKIFTYSDNQASNILFNFLGKDYINNLYDRINIDTRIIHQLGESAYSFSPISNNWTSNSTIYDDPQKQHFASSYQAFVSNLSPNNQVKGKAYVGKDGELINQSFDFSAKNYVPLPHLLGALERVTHPAFFSSKEQLNITEADRKHLFDIMKLRPKDLPYPIDTLPDNYVKFLMLGDQKDPSYHTSLKIFNKVGWAYGYLTDIAFIQDEENDVSFFLAATIHVNSNQIYNDGIYEYEEGLPFLGELGRLVYSYEFEKKATYK